MLDLGALLIAFVGALAIGLGVWRRGAGPAGGGARLALRLAALSAVAATGLLYGAWALMNARDFQISAASHGRASAQVDLWTRPELAPFREAVIAYRGDEWRAGVDQLLEMRIGELRAPAERAVRAEHAPQAALDLYRTVGMLHTDAAIRSWAEGRVRDGDALLDLARLWIDGSDPIRSPPWSFRRRWYAAAALRGAIDMEPRLAVQLFSKALAEWPDDEALLMAAAWFELQLALALPAPDANSLREVRRVKVSRLRRALSLLEDAHLAHPLSIEPPLLLARTRLLADLEDRVAPLLEPLLPRFDLTVNQAYIARLLLARARERSGDRDAAEALYREAIDLAPPAQSARLSLTRLLDDGGRFGEAVESLKPLLTAARSELDPWTTFQLAPVHGAVAQLDSLRKEACE